MDQYTCRDLYFFVSCLKLLSQTNRSHMNILEADHFRGECSITVPVYKGMSNKLKEV